MKQEHLIAFGGIWHHFYVSDRGLCVDTKENGRFRPAECLLKDAKEDFSVAATEKYLHCVCRGTDAVWYFLFDGTAWHSRKISEGKKSEACRRLTLLAKGNFIHLCYVAAEEKEHLLIHQLLGDGASRPAVVDVISGTDFSVSAGSSGDFTLLYHNGEGICGTKRFRWSQKAFEAFRPIDCGCDIQNAVLLAKDRTLHIAAYAVFDQFVNILFLTKDTETNDCKLSAVHLVSGESEGLILSETDNTLAVSWCENGLVMTSRQESDGHWSSPKKYIRGMERENVLYRVETARERFSSYGYPKNGRIMLYTAPYLPEVPPAAPEKQPLQPEQKNSAKEHAQPLSSQQNANVGPQAPKNPEFVKRTVYAADMASLRKHLSDQNDIMIEILKKLAAIERAQAAEVEAQEAQES